MAGTQSFTVFPNRLDRMTAPEALAQDAARILQNSQLDELQGRLRRTLGMVPSNPAAAYSTTAWNSGAFFTPAGNWLVLDDTENGTINVSTNPLPAWTNNDAFGASDTETWIENFDEDGPGE